MEKKKTFLINIAYYGFFAVLIFLAGEYALPVLMPFVWAFLFALLMQKPSGKLSARLHCRKKPVALLLLIVFYLLLLGLLLLGGGQLITVVGNFIARLPELYQTEIAPFLESILDKLGEALSGTGLFMAGEIENSLQQFVDNFGQTLSSVSVSILRALSGYITGIPSAILRLVITVVASFYLAADYDRVMGALKKYLPVKWKKTGRDIREHGFHLLKVYIKSYCLLFLMTFAELTVGFLILRIPHAVILGLAIAIFDILPVLGTGGILLPWMTVMLIMGNYPLAVGLLLLYVVITVIRNVVEPKIVGRQVGLHPLVTLIAMFVGLRLWGLAGLILFPLAAVVLINMVKTGAIPIPGREEEPEGAGGEDP